MPCNCGNKAASAAAANQKFKVIGTGDPAVDKVYASETDAQLALARSGKSGSVKPA